MPTKIMSDYPTIQLKRDKERSVLRFHPWIFSGAIQSATADLKDGDIVKVVSNKNVLLCLGHFFHGSIAVKILTFKDEIINDAFWLKKIQQALELRTKLDLVNNETTNCFRLIHAEGDNCPGLVIDIYHDTAVIQCHTIGMHHAVQELADALVKLMPFIKNVYDKSASFLPKEYATQISNFWLKGNEPLVQAKENDCQFTIDIEQGQKTGFFIDQRENRYLLGQFCKGKSVLNTYCYSGGFSIYALKNQADRVVSIDVSKSAIDLVNHNITLNFPTLNNELHQAYAIDVFDFFKTNQDKFDVIILDPPAFAKSINKKHNAVQAYKRLNTEGIKAVNNGGIIFTFSCSQVIDRELFAATVMSAAIDAGREVKMLHFLSQPPDHPINIFHPESAYLKGLVLYVE